MKKILQITCNKDASSREIRSGIESYEYHFLLHTKKEELDIDDFVKLLNESTHLNWRYKELCTESFFIFITRINADMSVDFPHGKDSVVFEVETGYVPKQSKYIKQITNE